MKAQQYAWKPNIGEQGIRGINLGNQEKRIKQKNGEKRKEGIVNQKKVSVVESKFYCTRSFPCEVGKLVEA